MVVAARGIRARVTRAAGAVLVAALLTLLAGSPASGGDARAAEPATFHDGHVRLTVPFNGQWYTVQVEFLMAGPADAASEAAEADAIAARFPGAFRGGEVSAQFVANNYWWPSHTTTWSYNASGKPAGLSGELSAIIAASDSWGAAGANFHFSGGGATGAPASACGSGGPDGQNTVGWAAQSGNTLAVTCSWFVNSGNPATETEFDMQIDPAWEWTTGDTPQIDLQSVVLHELGHALGLGHASDPASVMFASYTSTTLKRALQPDDIAGLKSIYGNASAPAPTPSPTPAAPPSQPLLPPSLALKAGANLLTWPGAASSPSLALSGPGSVVQAIYGWNAATRTWDRYFPGVPGYVNTLSSLKTGQPYWFVSRAAAQVPVPLP